MAARRAGNLRFPHSRNDRNFSCLSEASLRNFSRASQGLRSFSASQHRKPSVHFGAAKMDTLKKASSPRRSMLRNEKVGGSINRLVASSKTIPHHWKQPCGGVSRSPGGVAFLFAMRVRPGGDRGERGGWAHEKGPSRSDAARHRSAPQSSSVRDPSPESRPSIPGEQGFVLGGRPPDPFFLIAPAGWITGIASYT